MSSSENDRTFQISTTGIRRLFQLGVSHWTIADVLDLEPKKVMEIIRREGSS